jgi:hypothetical protein
MDAPENPPAFPRDHRHLGHNGMDLRDWFAGQALSGILASEGNGVGAYPPDWAAERSYILADAMLAARESSK